MQTELNDMQKELIEGDIEPFDLAYYILHEDPEIIIEIYPETGNIEDILKYYTYKEALYRFNKYINSIQNTIIEDTDMKNCETCEYVIKQNGLYICQRIEHIQEYKKPVQNCKEYLQNRKK